MGLMPAPVDVATAGRLRLSELALHSWDVRVAFDEHAALGPEATNQLLHGSSDMLRWISKPERRRDSGRSVWPSHHIAGADLFGPHEGVLGETGGPQERHSAADCSTSRSNLAQNATFHIISFRCSSTLATSPSQRLVR
jgi:hypothetical protein